MISIEAGYLWDVAEFAALAMSIIEATKTFKRRRKLCDL